MCDTFEQVIKTLGGGAGLARLLETQGLQPGDEGARVVRAWKCRKSIPADWFTAVAAVAADAGHPQIDLDLLAGIAARRRTNRPKACSEQRAA